MTYEEMLAGRGLKVGDQVVCTYRSPTAHQWWVAPWWVGVIEPVGTDKADWNDYNSEEYYSVLVKHVKVRYLAAGPGFPSFTQSDSLGNLRQLHWGTETESTHYCTGDYDKMREFASRCGMLDQFPPADAKAVAA